VPENGQGGFPARERKERAGHKPGSVLDNHSSGTAVAGCL